MSEKESRLDKVQQRKEMLEKFKQEKDLTWKAQLENELLEKEKLKNEHPDRYMTHKERVNISIRRVADNQVNIVFPEDISKDIDMISENGEIPLEFLNAALSRSLASRAQLAAGCSNKCGKDCFW